jgi:UDP-sulfoquinovose synthase
MHLAAKGHDICVIDNYLRRYASLETRSEPLITPPSLHERSDIWKKLTGKDIRVEIGDCNDYGFLLSVVRDFCPDAMIHYAEQPSAPYSMGDYRRARRTLDNNIGATFNAIWAIMEGAPDCHMIKLGTMGEYGTPNIDIEEGWIDIHHKGRSHTFLYPRQAGSFYHTTKVMDTDMIWFYVRTHNIQVTDLMQGPVYGMRTAEIDMDPSLMTIFNYDDIFGTVVNRFVAQAVVGFPLTVYGKGGQTRGYLNLKDTLQCVELALINPPGKGKLRVLNQFTEQFTVNELAEKVRRAGKMLGIEVAVQSIDNPRKEAEEHYYNAAHSGLTDLGLQPNFLTDEVMAEMIETVVRHRDKIDTGKVLPRVRWK